MNCDASLSTMATPRTTTPSGCSRSADSFHCLSWPQKRGWLVTKCQTLDKDTNGRNGRTHRRQESNLVHFGLKMWHMVAIVMIFLILKWPNFMYLFVDPDFLPSPLKFLWSIAVRSPIHWMDAPDIRDGQTDKETCFFVRPFVRSFVSQMEFDTT